MRATEIVHMVEHMPSICAIKSDPQYTRCGGQISPEHQVGQAYTTEIKITEVNQDSSSVPGDGPCS